jgi:hypothetical protein
MRAYAEKGVMMRIATLLVALAASLGGACDSDKSTAGSNTGTNTGSGTNTGTGTQTNTRTGSFGGSCMIVITAGGFTSKQCIDFYVAAADPASVARKSCETNNDNIQNTYSEGHCPLTADLLGKCAKTTADQYFYSGGNATVESLQQSCTSGGGVWSAA